MERLNFTQNDGGDRRSGARMKVDGKIKVRPEPFAQHFHVSDGASYFGVGFHGLKQIGELKFQRRYARGLRLVTKLTRLREGPGTGVIVTAYAARIDRAAQHLIDGHVHDLAAYVPERLIDSRD